MTGCRVLSTPLSGSSRPRPITTSEALEKVPKGEREGRERERERRETRSSASVSLARHIVRCCGKGYTLGAVYLILS